MICKSKNYISLQNRKKQYTLCLDYYLSDLSIWVKEAGLGYTQIGPTMLVEWEG